MAKQLEKGKVDASMKEKGQDSKNYRPMSEFRWLRHQNLLPWQRQKRLNRPFFQHFEANNLKTGQ